MAPLLGANCYLVGTGGSACVIVDPGRGADEAIVAALEADGLTPTAVLLTHGHLDHSWSSAELAARYGIPVRVHADDVYRLRDPIGSLGPLGAQIAALAGEPDGPPAPAAVEPFTDAVPFAGFTVLHAPGHTEGSTVFLLEAPGEPTVALTGDVLFAGTVGRTDLPGGDATAMARTLRRLAALPADTRVLPGHGPVSTIDGELATNPHLR